MRGASVAVAALLLLGSLTEGIVTREVTYINVAQGKDTDQSSVAHSGVSSRAVDGNTAGNWGYSSCTHTNYLQGVGWWEVDLGSVYNISHIEVYGRTDCCSDRIKGARLWVGNELCATLNDMGSAQMEHVECGDMVGRKVRIEKLGSYLTLCEVKVMVRSELEYEEDLVTDTPLEHKGIASGDLVNVAIHKKTSQAGTCSEGYSSKAVDGWTYGNYWTYRTCTCSKISGMNYWEVDLGRVYNIAEIRVWGRTDHNPSLNGATVKIGSVACGTINNITREETNQMQTITCDADKSVGQVVRIEHWNENIILCEVQVMVHSDALPEVGEIIPTEDLSHLGESIDDYFNVAKGKNASASSVISGGVAARAVDGVTNQNWNKGSCSHTNNRDNEWWHVDLGRVYQIDHIRIYARFDSRATSINGARLWIGDHRCGTLMAQETEGEPIIVECSAEESAGRYVTIENFDQYISLCEVQVMVNEGQIDLVPNTVASRGEVYGDFTNVALKAETSQSSVGWGGEGSRAVDGWLGEQNWGKGSCTHTNNRGVHWWEVDLGQSYQVDHIMIYGRTDNSHKTRILWARVWLGNTECGWLSDDNMIEEDSYIFRVNCTSGSDMPYGRRVRIERLANYLTLCEVNVMVRTADLDGDSDEMPTTSYSMYNVARHKQTQQSSVGWEGTPERAVDGYTTDYSLTWNSQSCTHTMRYAANTWEVDLGAEEYIQYIEIYGRADHEQKRLDGAILTVDNTTITGLSVVNKNHYWKIPLSGQLRGRFVKVTLEHEYLTLCEVLVWVDSEYDPSSNTDLVDNSLENIAAAGNAVVSASSEDVGGEAIKAVDGETDGNHNRGHCFSTAVQQGTPWWKVTFIDTATVAHVIVYPRLDKIDPSYIHGAEVWAGDKMCGAIAYEEGKLWYKIACEGAAADSVTISKPEGVGFLNFCEVVVQAAD